MHINPKKPICLTRLKKNTPRNSDYPLKTISSDSLNTQNQSNLKQSHVSIQTRYKYNSLKVCKDQAASQNRHHLEQIEMNKKILPKITIDVGDDPKGYIQFSRYHKKQVNPKCKLEQQIYKLRSQNKELSLKNQIYQQRLAFQKQQKLLLEYRIIRLEESMQNLMIDINPAKNMAYFQTQNYTYMPKKSDITQQEPFNLKCSHSSFSQRRLSLNQAPLIAYLPQDPKTKIRQYKNQLEIEKIRRINLQREVKNARQNSKIEFKNELQILQKKLQQYRQIVKSKDKDIEQKQRILSGFLKKSIL